MSGLGLIGYQFRLSKLKIISPVVYQVEVKERADLAPRKLFWLIRIFFILKVTLPP